MWEVDYENIKEWLESLDSGTRNCITAAVEILAEEGPSLGRPLVDTVSNSRHSNMKELRPPSPGFSQFRILFAFDPNRCAVLLLGGDKSGQTINKKKQATWNKWYEENIPIADDLYDKHLDELRKIDEQE